jgi:cellulose synthase/poly-beta-1,6-N-acetylglucosamine synthase-like glycosyltransferase
MKLGIDCARAGMPPLFCPDALVLSYFPANQEGRKSQRTRWEHGHLAMIFAEAPRLFWEGFIGGKPLMLALVADLCVPPLALLSMAVLASCGLAAIFYAAVGDALPLQIAFVSLSGFLLAVLMAWAAFARRILPIWSLARAPLYVLGKLPLYLKFLLKRQVEWVRSKRDEN